MLTPPSLSLPTLQSCLRRDFGLPIASVEFLPLGADFDSAVYRAVTTEGSSYFVKLRRGPFNDLAVLLPAYLQRQGVAQVIPPLPARDGRHFVELTPYTVIVHPFVTGCDGYARALTAAQWDEFGAALRALHTMALPQALVRRLPPVQYGARWRHAVDALLTRSAHETFRAPIAVETAAFLRSRRRELLALIASASDYAQRLQAQPAECVPCHGDIHAGNLLISDDGAFYIVDWDTLLLAPPARDLMFIGGAQGFAGCTAQQEETLFYRGYGQTTADPYALAYFRYERILEDVALYGEQLLDNAASEDDCVRSLSNLQATFAPGGTLETAQRADPA